MDIVTNITRNVYKRHASYITLPLEPECRKVIMLPETEQCSFVMQEPSCRDLAFKIDCTKLMFCTIGEYKHAYWLPLALLVLIGIGLIYLLNIFITEFFVNTTLAIGRKLDLNEYLTGVIVITIANTIYNFYELFYNHVQDYGMLYNSNVGTALIDFGVLVPIIILMKPHKIIKEYFIIDAAFIILNFTWLQAFYSNHQTSKLKSILLTCVYIIYILILWFDTRILQWRYTYHFVKPHQLVEIMYAKMPFKIFANMKNKKMHTDAEDKLMIKARRYAAWFRPTARGPANQYLLKQFTDDLLDLHYNRVPKLNKFHKIKCIFDAPFVILCRLVMPVIDLRKPCHKWSKLLRVINVILFPLACWFSLNCAFVGGSRRFLTDFLQEWPTPGTGPYFDSTVPSNVTGLVGKTVHLICKVKNLGNRTVSWVRHRDIHLLTVGRYTYTSDQRFEAMHSPHTEEWTLRIRYAQRKDSGIYECQISTTPPMGHSVYLTVVEPVTEIIGGPDLFINKGSTINLTCIVQYAPEPPPAMIWSHNRQIINFDSPRGGISLVTEKGVLTTSRLLVQKAIPSDSGVYTCAPSNANPATARVHILNGEHPAAMHHGISSNLVFNNYLKQLIITIFLFHIYHNIRWTLSLI